MNYEFDKNITNAVGKLIEPFNAKKVFIHSDILFGFKINFQTFQDSSQLLNAHYTILSELFKGCDIWMPSFNYDFTTNGLFSVNGSPSQVGALTEYFRKDIASWRSNIPVFSFSGNGIVPEINNSEIIDPFDSNSLFERLTSSDALLFYYGAGFQSSTILHYCERVSDNLLYRYDKYFKGTVIDKNNNSREIKLKYHCRPKGFRLEYDWKKLEADLINDGLLSNYSSGRLKIKLISSSLLAKYWIAKIQEEPLYLLDEETKKWVTPLLEKYGRKFLISDFE